MLTSLVTLSLLSAVALATPIDKAEGVLFKRQASSRGLALNATARIQGVSGNGISGIINFLADPQTEIVTVSYKISGLEGVDSNTTFPYHVHTNPVPSDGDCRKTLGHLDPLHLTDALLCDPSQPEYCQEGDLAGKHGRLNATGALDTAPYPDPYIRFWPQPLSILGRSIVIHLPNSTRIACGNITSQLDGTEDANGVPTNASSTYMTTYAQAAAPAPSTSYHLFASGGINSSLAEILTVPAQLPDVTSVPNAVLTTTTLTSSAGGALVTSGFPAVVPAGSSFAFSGQAATGFPQQSQSFPPASASSASASAAPSASGSTSSAGKACGPVGGAMIGLAVLVVALA